MIIGSGLLAQAFSHVYSQRKDVCIYAAGVSNSSCMDTREFARERERLAYSLHQAIHVDVFVYFGTCSVFDPESKNTPYVQHKLAMEQMALTHPHILIIRLPQVAGKTPNPHTLLNFLYARIARSESFNLWRMAARNIIDVIDAVAIAQIFIEDQSVRNTTLNIANEVNYPMTEIVRILGRVVGKRAVYNIVERGSDYPIDISTIMPVLKKTGVEFGDDYLERVLNNYY